jgi:hypothetical protein
MAFIIDALTFLSVCVAMACAPVGLFDSPVAAMVTIHQTSVNLAVVDHCAGLRHRSCAAGAECGRERACRTSL